MKSEYFQSFDGTRICYEYTKKGEKCLIFVHGLGGDMTAWKPERAYFEKLGYSTAALDLRGHGLSDRGESLSFYNFENFAKDIEALIKHLQIKKPILVGHCFGGIVSLYFAAIYQKLLSALILIDSSYKPPAYLGGANTIAHMLIGKLLSAGAHVLPNFQIPGHVDFSKFIGTEDIDVRRFTSDVLHTSTKGYMLMCKKLTGYDGKALLAKVTIPTFVLEGEEDTIFPPDIAIHIAERLKKSDLEFIPNANHILVINNAPEVNVSIERFLGRIQY